MVTEQEQIATSEEMKAEALKRMRRLGILKDARDDFKKTDCVWVSELQKTPFGLMPVLYYVRKGYTYYDEVQTIVDKVVDHGNLPYHAITNWVDGELWVTILFVSRYKEEWEYDKEDMENCTQLSYCHGYYDEYGSISFKSVMGGIVRTA